MTTSAAQITRPQVPNYHYLTPDVPDMVALGMNSPIVIAEQLVINDRLRPDRYVIKTITGLRGSDVRDTRVPRPSASGEIAYSSFYSGRTVTLEGTMEAGNIAELNRLERDLMAVLGPLPDAPLGDYFSQSIAVQYLAALQSQTQFPVRFNWWDQRDAFYDPQNTAFWGTLSGNQLVIPGNGRATATSGGATLSYHNLRGGFIDEVVTAQVSVSPMGGANQIGVVAGCTASNSYLQAVLAWDGSSTWTLKLQSIQPWVTTTLATGSLSSSPGQQTTLWVQLLSDRDDVVANLYAVDPKANPTATPIASCSATLLGLVSETFGYGQTGFVGLTANSTTAWCFQDWRVDSLYPCDMQFGARLIQAPAMSHEAMKIGVKFQRDFQFALRAADPRILCPTTRTVIVPVNEVSSQVLGRLYPRTYPIVYKYPLSEPTGALASQSASTNQTVVAVNNGTWVAKPVITIYGGVTNPTITNVSNGQSIVLDGTIAPNDYVQIDCLQFTMLNSQGVNVFSLFDPNSQWIVLQPGDNVLLLTGTGPSGSPYASVVYQSAWI